MTRVTIEQRIDGSEEIQKSTIETTDTLVTLERLLPLIEQAIRGLGYDPKGYLDFLEEE